MKRTLKRESKVLEIAEREVVALSGKSLTLYEEEYGKCILL